MGTFLLVFFPASVHNLLQQECGLLATQVRASYHTCAGFLVHWYDIPLVMDAGPLPSRYHCRVGDKRGSRRELSAEAHNLFWCKRLARLEHGRACPGDEMFPKYISIDTFKVEIESLDSWKYVGTAQLKLTTKLSYQTWSRHLSPPFIEHINATHPPHCITAVKSNIEEINYPRYLFSTTASGHTKADDIDVKIHLEPQEKYSTFHNN